jgi:hypothetical protein
MVSTLKGGVAKSSGVTFNEERSLRTLLADSWGAIKKSDAFTSGKSNEEWTNFANNFANNIERDLVELDEKIYNPVIDKSPLGNEEKNVVRYILKHIRDTKRAGTSSVEIIKKFGLNPTVSKQDSTNDFTFRLTKHLVRQVLQGRASGSRGPSDMNQFGSPATSGNAQFSRYVRGNLVDSKGQAADLLSVSENMDEEQVCDAVVNKGEFTSGRTCQTYLMQCLMNPDGNSINNCKEFLEDKDAFARNKAQVGAMPVALALQTLQALEWPFFNNNGVVRAGNVDQWHDMLEGRSKDSSSKLSGPEFTSIKGNTQLTTYLGFVVDRVNDNPAVLNPGASSAGVQSSSRFSGNLFDKWGIKGRVEAPSARAEVARLQTDLNNRNFTVRLGLPGMVGFSAPFNLQLGGSSLADLQARLNNRPALSGKLLKAQYQNLVSRLGRKGKSIDQDDHKQVEQLITSLLDSEDKLSNIVSYGEGYLDLLENWSVYDSDNILSLSHLKEFVDQKDKYAAKIDKKQSAITSILETVARAIEDRRQEIASGAASSGASSSGAASSGLPTRVNVSSLLGRN